MFLERWGEERWTKIICTHTLAFLSLLVFSDPMENPQNPCGMLKLAENFPVQQSLWKTIISRIICDGCALVRHLVGQNVVYCTFKYFLHYRTYILLMTPLYFSLNFYLTFWPQAANPTSIYYHCIKLICYKC